MLSFVCSAMYIDQKLALYGTIIIPIIMFCDICSCFLKNLCDWSLLVNSLILMSLASIHPECRRQYTSMITVYVSRRHLAAEIFVPSTLSTITGTGERYTLASVFAVRD